MNRLPLRALALMSLLALLAPLAQAHEGQGVAGGFLSGFAHPLLGWDHVIAMLAVGLWGAFLGAPALWLLPVVFLALGLAIWRGLRPLYALSDDVARLDVGTLRTPEALRRTSLPRRHAPGHQHVHRASRDR